MGTWTIYTAGADVTLLNAILNGVAMICTQTTFIWGFAILASFWRLFSNATAGSMSAVGGKAAAALTDGAFGAIVPLVLAMLLTNPAAQCTVQVQSVLNGNVTTVDNVPFVIAVIPVAGSELATNANTIVTTAFSGVNPTYDYISANGNGFLDPMRRLLGARTAIQRLNGIDSEIRTIVSSCLGKDAGVDYAQLNSLVINAGNSGATAAQSVPINGVSTTAIGALLFQAAQNQSGIVIDLNSAGQSILSCNDAVTVVQTDIDTALNSQEFSRVVQGAVNGMDQPNAAAAYDINQLGAEYTSLRKWSSVTGNLAGGQAQANAEAINFLFTEQVTSSLNCLQADGPDKSNCEAAMIQANEIERNNVQAAANEVPMLKYSGGFGNYILALIIGLGPIIVMFMMFAGTNLGTCIKTVTHILVWPILVMNVGAELVNAMISMQFANFMASVSQQGYLSLATMQSVYKELSLQVGIGSHIMASLPVLMSMIFALGETAALVSVSKEMTPNGKEVGEAQAPAPTASAPLTRQGSPVSISQGTGFARVQSLGGLNAVSMSEQFASMAREGSRSVSEAETRQKTLSEGKTNQSDWQRAFQTGNYSKWGLSQTEGNAIRQVYEQSLRSGHQDRTSKDAQDTRQNSNSSKAGVSGNAGIGVGGGGSPVSLGVGVSGGTETGALDAKSVSRTGSRSDSVDTSTALNSALSSDVARSIENSHGHDQSRSFRESRGASQNYQDLVSHANSTTDSMQDVQKVGSNLVGAYNKIGSEEIAQQVSANPDYRRFQLDAGRRRDQDQSTGKYRELAAQDMESGATDALHGNPEARDAAIRTRAAVLQFGDESAPAEQRLGAMKFLADGAQAMTHLGVQGVGYSEVQRTGAAIAEPVDRTGVVARQPAGAVSGRKQPKSAGASGGGSSAPGNQNTVGMAPTGAVTNALSGNGATTKVDEMFKDAEESGLGANGAGTVRRTAANVVDNAGDVVRPAGSRSRVRFGTVPPPPPPAAPTAPEAVPQDVPGQWG